jgi:hypothetical protein
MIYFITDGIFTKIGTTNCVERRISDFQVGNARELKCLAVVDGGAKEEWRIHRALSNRKRGEWFGSSVLLTKIIQAANRGDDISPLIDEGITHKKRGYKTSDEWREFDLNYKRQILDLYHAMVALHGIEAVAKKTGVSENMVKLVLRGKSIPSALPWLRFQAEFCDLKALQADLGTLIVEIEEIAA